MKKIRNILASMMIVAGLTGGVLVLQAPIASADAADEIQTGADVPGEAVGNEDFEFNLQVITNILLFIIGAIAVIMLVIGGLRYTLSSGDPSATKGAKDTILYAIVGIIIALLGFAIVNFVVGSFI